MQLRSDKDYLITPASKRLIEENNGIITDIDFIRSNFADLKIISVGDYTTDVLIRSRLKPWIEVVDLKTKRGEKVYSSEEGSVKVINPPGVISGSLIYAIASALHKNVHVRIEVDGEEDLAVLPILFYADENTVVIYGVPDVGMAYIRASDDARELISKIVKKMEVRDR